MSDKRAWPKVPSRSFRRIYEAADAFIDGEFVIHVDAVDTDERNHTCVSVALYRDSQVKEVDFIYRDGRFRHGTVRQSADDEPERVRTLRDALLVLRSGVG